MVEIAFYFPAVTLILASLNVAFSLRPVWGLLSLMLCFISTAILWLGLGAEFLALALIFIYVGAVMALFLFIVFMLNVDVISRTHMPGYYPIWFVLLFILGGYLIYQYSMNPTELTNMVIVPEQTRQLGVMLYQKYDLAFEVMGVALLASMLGAIALVLDDRRRS
ncbi:NADH-quinone oxidoreductase subunit J [Gammaproteobacteria bacterium]|nr:NADH-quinone oxidoreductase subunit J [Gammaproteobacteria bacterium]